MYIYNLLYMPFYLEMLYINIYKYYKYVNMYIYIYIYIYIYTHALYTMMQ